MNRRPPSRQNTDSSFDEPLPSYARRDGGNKWIGWSAYAVLALVGFCFGAWAGNQRPKVIEVVKSAPEETKPPEKKEPEKKEQEKKEPEPKIVTPAPKPAPMPKPPDPKPEPKPPEPKPKPPEPKPKPVTQVSFEKEILPIFRSKCNLCHGDTKGVKGGLELKTLASIAKGGDSGDALVPGKPDSSLIWTLIEDGSMPPPDKPQLTEAEKTKIKNWILSGGK